MALDYAPRIRQQKDLERKLNKRASYDRILIVSEGKKTEPLYFEEIRIAHRLHATNVQVYHSEKGTDPLQVIKYAKQLFEKGDNHKKIPKRAFERVFAVFDRDEHLTYFDALGLASSLNGKLRNDENNPVIFRAIPSIPNFELWFLLHYEDIQSALHRDAVIHKLKKHIPNYQKGSNGHFLNTKNNLEFARQRAHKLKEKNTPWDEEPYTDVVELVTLLENLSLGS